MLVLGVLLSGNCQLIIPLKHRLDRTESFKGRWLVVGKDLEAQIGSQLTESPVLLSSLGNSRQSASESTRKGMEGLRLLRRQVFVADYH